MYFTSLLKGIEADADNHNHNPLLRNNKGKDYLLLSWGGGGGAGRTPSTFPEIAP